MTQAATVCDKCGEPIGAPHLWSDDDCVFPHADHTPRYVGLICKRHYHWIDGTLEQILALYTLASVMPRGGESDHRGNGEVFAPAPGRLDVMALTDRRAKTPIDLEDGDIPDLPGTLATWAHETWLDRGDKAHAEPVWNVTTSITFLRRERHWIAQQPFLDDYTAELAYLHRWCATAAGDSMWPKPIGHCPTDRTPLFNTIGVDEVTCSKCKQTWSGVHLIRLRLMLEQEAG